MDNDKQAYYLRGMATDPIGILLSDAARLMRRRFDQRARAHGVTRAQWQVLAVLARNEGISQAGLADRLELESITVGRMVDRLEEAGHVERRADPADRRVWRLHLTDAVGPLLDEMRSLAEEVTAEALQGLSAGDREALATGLEQIRANLSRSADMKVAS